MRKTLTDKGVEGLKPRAARYAFPDPELPGHYIRVTPSGAKSGWAVSRDPTKPKGKEQVWAKTGTFPVISISESRELAREALKRIRAGLAPFEPPAIKPESFGAVAENWFKRHVEAKGLRSASELRRTLDRYILPVWCDRDFLAIRRSDIAALLDRVEDENGKRQADQVLAIVRGLMNWVEARSDEYQSPVARGMRRSDPKARARARILDDDEIRRVWSAAEQGGTFGAFVRLALLTAQRRDKLASMKWIEIVDGEWRMATEAREKGTAGALVLPDAALAIIESQPRLASNPYVLSGRAGGAYNGFSRGKRDFDRKAKVGQPWVIHDLRRSARSLMSRAGVRSEIAERVMGHVIAGVEGVYDRHSYRDEKADALARLARLIDSIVNPTANVIPLRTAAP